MTPGEECELPTIPTLKRQLPSPDAWLNSIRLRLRLRLRLRQQGES